MLYIFNIEFLVRMRWENDRAVRDVVELPVHGQIEIIIIVIIKFF